MDTKIDNAFRLTVEEKLNRCIKENIELQKEIDRLKKELEFFNMGSILQQINVIDNY